MTETHDLFGWVGATLDGKYRVDAVVGEGGFGIVYRAHHLGFDQTVAIKCLRLPKTLSGPERDRFRETFLAEGRLLHQLSRANAGIVQALDLGAAVSPNKHWTPYLVLEWLDGVPLDREFSERRGTARPLGEVVQLLASAARALGVAHAQGVAHRDIKPANLFLAKVAGQTVVKVLDFGIAKVMSESESVTKAFEETGASMQAFTARYGAPEQFSRRYGATGPWTDVFALTLVFVEAVSGRQALDGRDAAQLFVAAADSEHRPTLRALGVDTSDEVEAVLARALCVDPRNRYANANEFWDALEAATFGGDPVTQARGSDKLRRGSIADPERKPTPAWNAAPADYRSHPEALAPAATDLNASTQLPTPPPVSDRKPLTLSRIATIGGAALVMGGSLTVAVRLFTSHDANLEKPPSAVAEAASSAPVAAMLSTAQPSAAPATSPLAEPGAAPQTPPPAVTPPPPPRLAGVPSRDILAGPVGKGSIGAYRLVARESVAGLDFFGAAKECADVGLSLCSEAQWTHACAAFPELSAYSTWTSTLKGEHVVVRGGQDCSSESQAAPVERALNRVGMCCERAIAMTSENLQKNYLSTTAERVLSLERALNQRNVQALLDLSEGSVAVDDQPKTPTELRALIEADFRSAPGLYVLNDSCAVSVQAKKITKGTRRKKKVVFQTQGWTADCAQTAVVPGVRVDSRRVTYTFSASSKLREITTKPEE
ncbi:MAG: serine/threonine-protein kinase [Polyangiaceae bacterium]